MKETNKEIRKKRRARKNVIDGRKHYIGRLQKTGEKDWDKLRVNDYGHNEGRAAPIPNFTDTSSTKYCY